MPVLALEPFAHRRAYVLEVSSYQIDLAPSLHASVGILLNVTEDHLDRHGSMENYAAIKERLPANVQANGTAVIGVDDDWTRATAERIARAGKRVERISVLAPLREMCIRDRLKICTSMASSVQPPKHAQNVRFSPGASSRYHPVGLSYVLAIALPPLCSFTRKTWHFAAMIVVDICPL